MTLIEAMEMTRAWPRDKTVPRKLADAINKAKGEEEKEKMGWLIEGLYVDCRSDKDINILKAVFDQQSLTVTGKLPVTFNQESWLVDM